MSSREVAKRVPPSTPRILSGPELWRLDFERKEVGPGPDSEQKVRIDAQLGLTRFSRERLGVELRVSLRGVREFRLSAAFRTVFDLDDKDAEGKQIEERLRELASRIAPGVMYPFVRETVASVAQRSGLPPLVLPMIHWGSVFDPAMLEIPAAPKKDTPSSRRSGKKAATKSVKKKAKRTK